MSWTLSKIFDQKALQQVAFWKNRDTGEGALNVEGEMKLLNSDGEVIDPSTGASAATGGGTSTYSTAQGDFVATTTTGTTNITLTGLPFTLTAENVANGSIKRIASDGTVTVVDSGNISVSGGVITLSEADNFVSGDSVVVSITGPDKAYDEALDANITTVLNSEYAHYTSPEHLIDVSAVGDAVTSRYVIPMESFKNISIQVKLANTNAGDTITLTMYATNNADADDSADTDWVDVSSTILGAANKSVNNATLEEIYFVDTNMIPLKYMIKTITISGGTDTNACDVYLKKA